MASAVLATSIIDICTNMRDNDTIVKYKILSSHLHNYFASIKVLLAPHS